MGIFYQAISQFLGFKNYGDEYKVMGLSSYGNPNFENELSKVLIRDHDPRVRHAPVLDAPRQSRGSTNC